MERAHPVQVRTASVVEKKDAIGKLSVAPTVLLRYGARDGAIAIARPSKHFCKSVVYP